MGPDIENCQVVGFASGSDAGDAFVNLIRNNGYLLETTFDHVRSYRLGAEYPEREAGTHFIDDHR